MDDDDEDEDEDEEGDEDGEGEDRSHGLSVCSFDVLSPHCSPLCILYLSYYTLYTILLPAGTTAVHCALCKLETQNAHSLYQGG